MAEVFFEHTKANEFRPTRSERSVGPGFSCYEYLTS